MKNPTLHKVFDGSRNLYWVGEYPLYLHRAKDGWKISAPPSRPDNKQWLQEQGLANQSFQSRKEALQMLLFALEQPGSPDPDPAPTCKRNQDGSYSVQDGVCLVFSGRGWDIYQPDGEHHSHIQGSLWRALWAVESLVAPTEPDHPWSKSLRYDRHQRGVAEGSDKPIP